MAGTLLSRIITPERDVYNKLFSKILQSSIWLEPDPTRLVWITLLAAKDKDGFAAFSAIGNLAHAARVPVEAAKAAVETLEAPDPESGNKANEGRRIERVPGGWILLNAKEYDEIANAAHARALDRARAKAYRERHGKPEPSREHHDIVTPSDSSPTPTSPSINPKSAPASVTDAGRSGTKSPSPNRLAPKSDVAPGEPRFPLPGISSGPSRG